MFSRAKFLVSCPSSAVSAVSLKKNTSCCCSSPTPVRNISSSSSSTSMRVEGIVSTGEDLTNPSAFHNARSMDFRDWLSVERFMLAIVRDERKLSSFGIKDAEPDLPFNFSVEKTLENVRDVKKRSHQKQTESKRAKYCVRLKYFGNAFASFAWDKNMDDTSKHSNERFYGDQWTPGNASVVATIRESLGEHCKWFDKEKHPIVYQSGRTDRNVSGAGQIVQIFRDAKDHLERRYIDEREEEEKCELIRRAINESTEVGKRGYLRAVECFRVNAEWHASFSATWRRYVYIVPKRALDVDEVKGEMRRVAKRKKQDDEDLEVFTQYGNDTIDCELLDRMLRKFENKTIDMYAFARDTAQGKATECKMLYARAKTISIPKFQMKATNSYGKRYRDRRYKETSLLFEASNNMSAATEEEEEEPLECVAIELVADRFLRKMVRCIVSTACREALLSNTNQTEAFNEDVLLELARNGDRMALAPPAPPYGLLFCGVGYGNSHESFVTEE